MQERDNKKMKYAVLLCDGMADLPREDIGGTAEAACASLSTSAKATEMFAKKFPILLQR